MCKWQQPGVEACHSVDVQAYVAHQWHGCLRHLAAAIRMLMRATGINVQADFPAQVCDTLEFADFCVIARSLHCPGLLLANSGIHHGYSRCYLP